jgi:hypothetical protein
VYINIKPRLSWVMNFNPPLGAALQPGTYEAADTVLANGSRGRMNVFGEGRACNGGAGRFTVLEIRYEADGAPGAFAAEFEYHCPNTNASVFGSVSIGTDRPVPELPTHPEPDPATNFVLMEGDPGDFISGGQRRVLADAGDNVLAVHERGRVVAVATDGRFRWQFNLWAPTFREISARVYDNAVGVPAARQPAIDVSRDGSACSAPIGHFIVHEVEYGRGSEITRLAVDLEQRCAVGADALRASIRVNSNVPPGTCPGDCDGDRQIAIPELLLGVNALLNDTPSCRAFDGDGDGAFGIDALVRAVASAFAGCVGPTPS